MRNDERPPERADDKSPHERFTEFGRRLMAVPKAEADAKEKDWQSERKRVKKR